MNFSVIRQEKELFFMFFMLNRFVIQYKLVTLHPLFAKHIENVKKIV